MNINRDLKKYIEETIFPIYEKNDLGHNLSHINYVINRSLKFASTLTNINFNMVYTIAAYHDIGHYIDFKNHEKISAEILLNDKNLKHFFDNDQIKIMAEAIEDHRASLEYEPRNIYGKIVSSADKDTNIDNILRRTYSYRIKNFGNNSLDQIIDDSISHIKKKFGENGYAKQKMYFKDEEYEIFLEQIKILIKDRDLFKKKYIEVNNISFND